MLTWLGAIMIGVCLGLLGSGGSIITVPILVYLVGHPEKQSIAESLVIVGGIALVGAIRAARARRLDGRSIVLFGLPGMAAAYAAAFGARWISGGVQLVILAAVMLAAAVFMYRRRDHPEDLSPRRISAARLALSGAAVGALTGIIGVGGGFLIVPALVLLGGLPIHSAIGTSLAIIFLNCATSFAGHHLALREFDQSEHWPTVLLFTGLGVAGALAGQSIGGRLDRRLLGRIFAVFLVLMCGYILVQEMPGLL